MSEQTIWKFPLMVADEQSVVMPEDARPLTVQVQNERPILWAVVNPLAPRTNHRFLLRVTGHPLGDVGNYIGSFQLYGGALVFHLFSEATP